MKHLSAALAVAAEPGKRAAAYARFSNAQQDGKVATLADQLVDERERALGRGHTIVAEFADDGISAWKRGVKRPGYDALLDLIESDGVDFVYMNRTDRTTRQALQLEMLLMLCEEHGVTLIEGGESTDPANDDQADMRRMKNMFDRRYSSKVSANVRNARAKSAAKGLRHPGPRPFGYDTDHVTLHPVEGPAYRELFERVIGGEGLTAISRDFAERGILSPRTRQRFDVATLIKLVRAPRAIGKRVHRGEVVGDMAEGFEPVVDEATQRRALAALASRRAAPRTTHAPIRKAQLLSGFVVCAECGRKMRVRSTKVERSGTVTVAYQCEKTRGRSCGRCSITAARADEVVIGRFLALLRKPQTVAALAALHDEHGDVSGLLGDVEALRVELTAIAAERAAGDLTTAEWRVLRDGVQARLTAAERKLEDATDAPALLGTPPHLILSQWDTWDADQRRKVLAAWLDSVEVRSGHGKAGKLDPERIICHWRV